MIQQTNKQPNKQTNKAHGLFFRIKLMTETGLLKRILTKHWPVDVCTMKQREPPTARELTLNDVASLFIIMGVGLALGSIALLGELATNNSHKLTLAILKPAQ